MEEIKQKVMKNGISHNELKEIENYKFDNNFRIITNDETKEIKVKEGEEKVIEITKVFEENVNQLWSLFNNQDINKYKEDDNFRNLTNSILNSGANINLKEHYLQSKIDISWIEAIEKTIIPLDNILRSPRKFIKNEEETGKSNSDIRNEKITAFI